MLPEDRVPGETARRPDIYVACADEGAAERTLRAAKTLREFAAVEVDASLRSLKKQMKNAEKSGALVTVIVESESPTHLKWKNMEERAQVDVPDDELVAFAGKRFGTEHRG